MNNIRVAVSDSFVSGIFASLDQAQQYLRWCNDGYGDGKHRFVQHRLVDTGCITFPIYILERSRGKFEYYQGMSPMPLDDIEGPYTIYTIRHPWQAPLCGQDFMGLLDHEHYNEPEDEE